ncbi:MAG: T9SS type A sorting domain-containing protein, partial [Candidatus Omnitrophica bacterium]|nr:T9SS type A sorting domain-containing protein [Candidatus Omnitrophota bacterium]
SGVTVTEGTPVYYYLEQNYPNPFNPSTTIEYILGSKTFVKLTIYDIMGREIALLESTEKGAGTYKIDFNAVSLPSGVYFYKLETEDYTSSRPMILLK